MRQWRTSIAVALAMAVGVGGAAVAFAAEDDPYVLVKNRRNPIESLTPADVRNIFTGKTGSFATGSVQLVFVKSNLGGPTWLAEKVLDIPMQTLFAKIRQEVFRERMNKPILVDTDSMVMEAVEKNAAAIGLVARTAVDGVPNDVAVVPIMSEGGHSL